AGFTYDAFDNMTSDVEVTSASPVTVTNTIVNGVVTGVESFTTMTPAPFVATNTQWLLNRVGTVSTQVWTPSTQSQSSVIPRTVDYAYDPQHPALARTTTVNMRSSDPTAITTTTIDRNADGVPTQTTVGAFDPVLGNPT